MIKCTCGVAMCDMELIFNEETGRLTIMGEDHEGKKSSNKRTSVVLDANGCINLIKAFRGRLDYVMNRSSRRKDD